MIRSNELMIGNLLFYGDGELIVDINVLRDIDTYIQLGAKPIELTREHILRYSDAWEESIDSKEIIVYDRFLFIWKPSYKYWYVVTRGHMEYLTKIEFVHEYQNFIFVMTGEGLTINSL